jgi:hypothetical protein
MADKGIRVNVDRKFMEMLPQRAALGNTPFRKAVMTYAIETFAIPVSSASSHYNHAKIKAQEAAKTNPEVLALLGDLGRAEDKKGGRKPKAKVETQAAGTGETQAGTDAAGDTQAADTGTADAAGETQTAAAGEQAADAPKLHTVYKKIDDTVVAENVSFFDAVLMVEKAKKAKKGKETHLYYK